MLSCPRISSLMSATREGHRGNVHKRIVAALLSHRGFYWFSKKGHSGGFFWQDPTLGLRPLWIFHKASPATAHVSAGRHTALYCTLPPNVGASIQWSSKLYRKLYRRSSLHKPIEEMVSLCDGSDCFDCWRVRRNQTPFQTQLCEKLGGQSWWDVQVSKHQLYTFFIQTQVCEIQIGKWRSNFISFTHHSSTLVVSGHSHIHTLCCLKLSSLSQVQFVASPVCGKSSLSLVTSF